MLFWFLDECYGGWGGGVCGWEGGIVFGGGRGFGCAESVVLSLFWAGEFLCVKDYFGGARVGCRVEED